MRIPPALKNLTERLLRPFAGMRFRREAGQYATILAYHNVVPDDWRPVGDRSLHLPLSRFRAHLDALARVADIVSLEGLVAESRTPRSRPQVALTFDDAYHGTIALGLAELRRRNLPATVFVPPAFLDGRSFWWDRWIGPLDEAAAERFRANALGPSQGRTDHIDASAAAAGMTAGPIDAWMCCSGTDALRAACAAGLVHLGSHTWDHPNLATLRPDAAISETFDRTNAWLREFGAPTTGCIAAPYGGYADSVEPLARRAGHEHLLLVEGGRIERRAIADTFALPRLSVPSGLSADGLLIRLAGLR